MYGERMLHLLSAWNPAQEGLLVAINEVAIMSNDKDTIHGDARGQFAQSQADRKASGVVSAKPTVITGSEDGTAHKLPPGTKAPKSEIPVHYDPAEMNEGSFRGSR
jgi:hypothetical protein